MKKLFTIINLVVLFFIIDFSISALYDHFIRKFEVDDDFKNSDVQKQKVEKKNFRNQLYYKNIARRDLFKTGKIDKSIKTVSREIQLTRLTLELKGTIIGTGSEPFAVIRKKGEKKDTLYRTGDMLDRAVIKKIQRERVILLVDGKKEILLMKKNTAQKNLSVIKQKNTGVALGGSKTGSIDNIPLTWDDVEKLNDGLKNMKKQLKIRPHFYKGKLDGLRITGLRKNSIFYTKLGLRIGDIMAAVNEEPIHSINDVINFYKEFKQRDGDRIMDMDIKRRNLPKKNRYLIEQG